MLQRIVVAAVVIGGVVWCGVKVWAQVRPTGDVEVTTLTYRVKPRDLKVTVSESGNLESQKTVKGICELNSYENKIISIVDEGTLVKEGDVVVKFDSSKIDEQIAKQEIEVNSALAEVEANEQEIEVTRNENESTIATAQMELDLAKLDLRKYKQGDYLVKKNELRGKIALAEAELQKASDGYMHLKELVKSGYRQPEQLQGSKQEVESAKFNLRRDKESLRVLEKFEHERSLTEFAGKAKEAVRKLDRAKKSAVAKLKKAEGAFENSKSRLKMEEKQLKEFLEEKTKCEIKAPQEGIVAYAESRRWGAQPVGPGVTVYQQQTIFHLPDMTRLKVKVNIHESVVKKVKIGQKAKIRVEAFPNILLDGTVTKVAVLADSSRSWLNNGVKEYTSFVNIDELPEEQLKPGMSAEVEILVGEYENILAVPVQAVTEQRGRHYAFVKVGDEFETRKVKVGHNNDKFIEVVSGLSEGDEIALDARERALEAAQKDQDAFQPDGLTEEDEEEEASMDEQEEAEKQNVASEAKTPTNDDAESTIEMDAKADDEQATANPPKESHGSSTPVPAESTISATAEAPLANP